MDLHRPKDGIADWEHVSPDEWNIFQHFAAATNGIVTPANIGDALSLRVFRSGFLDVRRDDYLNGVPKILGSVSWDLFNGKVADVTGTKSPFGEKLDPGLDLLRGIPLVYLTVKKGLVPPAIGAAIALRKAGNATAIGIAQWNGAETHTSPSGKLAELTQGIYLGAQLVTEYAEQADLPELKEIATVAGRVSLATFAATGTWSTVGYCLTAVKSLQR